MRKPCRVGALVAAAVLPAETASAHAFGARYDLPLPLHLWLGAAAVAVLVSVVYSALFLRRRSIPRELKLRIGGWAWQIVCAGFAVTGFVFLGILIAAAFAGPPEVTRNFATVFVWVLWWVGFLLISALVIDIWPMIDPFRRFAARRPTLQLPAAAGYLAPLGVFCFAWIELVSDWSDEPRALGVLVCVYCAGSIVAGRVFGVDWFTRADPLGRMFELLSRMAPIKVRRNGITVQFPAAGLSVPKAPQTGEAALVGVLIGVVLFDGLSETPAWKFVLDSIAESKTLRPGLLLLRDNGVDLLKMLRSIGLISIVVMTILVWRVLAWSISRAAKTDIGASETAQIFAATLLPIAVAYHLAHYTSYLLIAGQLAIPAASDPFAMGWDLLGTKGYSLDIGVITAGQVWWVAFGAMITGHCLSVAVGHRRALNVYADRRTAIRSQLPMAFAMIGLTVVSLWILSQPIVE